MKNMMINQISWGTTYSHSISRCTLHSIRNPPRLVDLFRLQIPSDTPNTWELCPKMGNPQKPEILLDCWTRFFFKWPYRKFKKYVFFNDFKKQEKFIFRGLENQKQLFLDDLERCFCFFFIRRKRETNIIEKHNIFWIKQHRKPWNNIIFCNLKTHFVFWVLQTQQVDFLKFRTCKPMIF